MISAQRAALELPHIENFSPISASISGGEEMHIKGPNIFPDSKVIFLEKGPGTEQSSVVSSSVSDVYKHSFVALQYH